MPDFTLLLLPVIALLFFFLPGMAAVFAFSGKKSRWRHDDIHFITISCGLSISFTALLLALTYLVARAGAMPFPFAAVPAVLAIMSAAFLIVAALRGRLPGMRTKPVFDVEGISGADRK